MNLPEEPEDTSPQINIIPMIDVIFAILTFFIMSTLFLSRSTGLPVNLPTAATSETQQQSLQQITLSIDKQGNLALDRQPMQIDEIGTQVERLRARKQQEVVVIISADRVVPHGQIVAVMDKLRSLSGVRIAIATVKE